MLDPPGAPGDASGDALDAARYLRGRTAPPPEDDRCLVPFRLAELRATHAVLRVAISYADVAAIGQPSEIQRWSRGVLGRKGCGRFHCRFALTKSDQKRLKPGQIAPVSLESTLL